MIRQKLEEFACQCDVIIHLAALNRHNNPQTIYETNILLVNKLIDALNKTSARPHILFASSTQEERDNMLANQSVKAGNYWQPGQKKNNSPFTVL